MPRPELMTSPAFSKAADSQEDALVAYLQGIDRRREGIGHCVVDGSRETMSDSALVHTPVNSAVDRFMAQERLLTDRISSIVPSTDDPVTGLGGRMLGDFRLGRMLGRGGMGVVFAAEQVTLRRPVAVKVISGVLGSDPRSRARFRNETEILAQLRHAHIVEVMTVGEESGVCYYAMDLIDGGDVNQLISAWGRPASEQDDKQADRETRNEASDTSHEGSPASIDGEGLSGECGEEARDVPAELICSMGAERYRSIAALTRAVADALTHAHACGVLHRDLKPSNILLDRSGKPYLSDFGLARIRGQETLTELGDVVGTLRYASPEQVRGTSGQIDERSDVYSLGATLWEMLAARRIFSGDEQRAIVQRVLEEEPARPSKHQAGIPFDLETIALCALAKEPERRYQSAALMRDDLDRFLSGFPIVARPTTWTERAFLWANRNRRITVGLAATVVVLLLVTLAAAALVGRANRRAVAALAASRESEATAIRRAYETDLLMADEERRKGNPSGARELIDRYVKFPDDLTASVAHDPRGIEWHYLDRQLRERSDVLFAAPKALYVVCPTPDGKHFFTAGEESVIRRHELPSGNVVASIDTRQIEINCLSFSPSGELLVAGGDDGTIVVCRTDSLEIVDSARALPDKCYSAAFVENEQQVVCGGYGSDFALVDRKTGKVLRTLQGPALPSDSGVRSLNAWATPGSRRLLACYIGYSNSPIPGPLDGIECWDLTTGERRRLLPVDTPSCVVANASETLAFVYGKDTLSVVDVAEAKTLQSIPLLYPGGPLKLSPDGRLLAVGNVAGEILVYDVARHPTRAGEILTPRLHLTSQSSDVFDVRFDPQSQSLLSVHRSGEVRRSPLTAETAPCRELAWARGKSEVIPIPQTNLALSSPPLEVRELSTGRLIRAFVGAKPRHIAVSHDGRYVAAISTKGIRAWDWRQDSLQVDASSPPVPLSDSYLTFNSGEPTHLVAAYDFRDGSAGCIESYSLPTGVRAGQFHHSITRWVVGSAGGGVVFHVYHPKGTRCIDLATGESRWDLPPWEFDSNCAAASLDGQKVVLGDKGRSRVMLVDGGNGGVAYQVPTGGRFRSLAVSYDGKTFFLGRDDGAVTAWSVASGRHLVDLGIAPQGPITELAVAAGQVLARTEATINGRQSVVWYEFDCRSAEFLATTKE